MSGVRKRSARATLAAVALPVLAAAVALAVVLAFDGTGASEADGASLLQARAASTPRAKLPAPPEPAFVVPTPRPLDNGASVSLWAPVKRPAVARAAPSTHAAVVARLATSTPEGTANVVLVLGRKEAVGELWVRVRLAVLPNGSTGWVARNALGGYTAVHTRLVVELDRLRATLFRDGRPVFAGPVGVGQERWPTPTGEFYVRNKLVRYESPFYGPLAFGTSARSSVLTDWPAGGFVGIHGTDRPDLLPGRISHGCIRMRNEDIIRLGGLMPVGTPVTIRS